MWPIIGTGLRLREVSVVERSHEHQSIVVWYHDTFDEGSEVRCMREVTLIHLFGFSEKK